ncbi:MAG: hypothetical protein GW859_09075 [Sphingomonadales bacterium]|nr:hypothetical protein [Sphingomonadales bacterium]
MKRFAVVALATFAACPAFAQDTEPTTDTPVETAVAPDSAAATPAAEPALPVPAAATTAAEPALPDPDRCELHVWASDQYESVSMGLLSSFGLVGALLDQAGRGKEKVTIKDLMAEYLDPATQFATLETLDPAAKLGMPGAEIVWHDDMLTLAQRKNIKKNKRRLSDSQASCYGELINGVVFYHRAAMHGSNLFGGFIYRDFSDSNEPRVSIGKVKNPLESFPPDKPEDEAEAKTELVDAWAKDFNEFIQKKLK